MARALLEVGEKSGDPGQLQDGLRKAAAALRDLPELESVLSNPALAVERRKKIVSAVFAEAPTLLRRLLELLVAHEAIGMLSEIERAYSAQWNAKRGVVSAQAITAVPLDPTVSRELERAIAKATGLTAELSTETDPAVLGGVLLQMAGRNYDGTVRGRLQALRRSLKGDTRS